MTPAEWAAFVAAILSCCALIVTPEQWGNIMGYNDAGRPIYTASQPSNAGGAVSPQSLRGTVAGLDLYVSRNFTGTGGDGTADYSMAVVNPDAYTWYESPRLSLRTNVINTGQIDVNYYGYGALATKIGQGYYQSGYGRGFKKNPIVRLINGKAYVKDATQTPFQTDLEGYVMVNAFKTGEHIFFGEVGRISEHQEYNY